MDIRQGTRSYRCQSFTGPIDDCGDAAIFEAAADWLRKNEVLIRDVSFEIDLEAEAYILRVYYAINAEDPGFDKVEK